MLHAQNSILHLEKSVPPKKGGTRIKCRGVPQELAFKRALAKTGYSIIGEKVEDFIGKNIPIDDVLFSLPDSANFNTNKKFKEALQSRKNNDIVITEKQFGKKNREHAKDYGLDPGNEDDRIKLLDIIDDIIDNAEEVVRGKWKCQDGPVLFYRKGEDLVLVREKDNNFISIFQGGANNGWFKDTRGR